MSPRGWSRAEDLSLMIWLALGQGQQTVYSKHLKCMYLMNSGRNTIVFIFCRLIIKLISIIMLSAPLITIRDYLFLMFSKGLCLKASTTKL